MLCIWYLFCNTTVALQFTGRGSRFANWHLINAMSASLGHPPVNKSSASYWNIARWWTNGMQGWLAGSEEPQIFRGCPCCMPLASPAGPVVLLSWVCPPCAMGSVAVPLENRQSLQKTAKHMIKGYSNLFPALTIGIIWKEKKKKSKQKERGSHYSPCWVEAKLIKKSSRKARGRGAHHKIFM